MPNKFTPAKVTVSDNLRSERRLMFYHVKELQYHAKPERPDSVFARMLQEVLGGQWGEI